MEYVEAPDLWEGVVRPVGGRSIFLAGGITGCPDWQSEFVEKFRRGNGPYALLNPRRAKWDASIDSRQQILWERLHIDAASDVIVWFPKETLCPITLFELGTLLSAKKPVYVGCDPGYARKVDLEIQVPLLRETHFAMSDGYRDQLEISSSLEDLFKRVA